jgi:8-oxo-dGTP diphosphatase
MKKESTPFDIPEVQIRHEAAEQGIIDFVVGIALLNDQKLLLVRRVLHDFLGGYYELPGGGVEAGETFAEATTREAFEETGLRVVSIIDMIYGFDYHANGKIVRQINFIVKTDTSAIVLNPQEHDHALWASSEEAQNVTMTDEMKKSVKSIFERVL